MWLGWKKRLPREATARDHGSKVPLITGVWARVAFGIGLGMGFPEFAFGGVRNEVFVAGPILMLAGMALRLYSVHLLGAWFTLDVATRPGQKVVTSGPYQWIRHPSYTGALVTLLGILLCCLNWLTLAALLPAITGYAYRIRVEEAVLGEELGAEYREYMKRTRRLIPFIV